MLPGFLVDFFHARDSPLAQDLAVLLPGNLLGHLEHHFDQSIFRKLLGPEKQHARLAQVLDRPLAPGPKILHAIADWRVQLDSSCARDPGGLARVWPALR